MHVRTMAAVVDVLARGRLPEAAAEAARRWGADRRSLRYVRSSSTFVFRFEREGAPQILRLHHVRERTREHLAAELDFIEHVAACGVLAARALPSLADNAIEAVEGDGERFWATSLEWADGLELRDEELDEPTCVAWGELLSGIHRASRSFTPRGEHRRPAWDDELRAARGLPAAVAREIERGFRWTDGLPRGPDTFGLIHRDVELDNIRWDRDQFRVFDFDDAMYCWYAADVASAVHDIWHGDEPRRTQKLAAFMRGYGGSLDDLETVRGFLRLSQLRKFVRLRAAYAGTDVADDPEWLTPMRERHAAMLEADERELSSPFDWPR